MVVDQSIGAEPIDQPIPLGIWHVERAVVMMLPNDG